MNLPDIIGYLFSLRYPGTEDPRENLVCYQGSLQVILPIIPSGRTIRYEARPQLGTFAQIGYLRVINSDLVPNTLTYTIEIGGTIPMSGVITQVNRDMEHPGYAIMSERSPVVVTVTNISPLAQRAEMIAMMAVIPTPKDLETIADALRRLHTSAKSEQLLQQATYLLGLATGQSVEPRSPVGGS